MHFYERESKQKLIYDVKKLFMQNLENRLNFYIACSRQVFSILIFTLKIVALIYTQQDIKVSNFVSNSVLPIFFFN